MKGLSLSRRAAVFGAAGCGAFVAQGIAHAQSEEANISAVLALQIDPTEVISSDQAIQKLDQALSQCPEADLAVVALPSPQIEGRLTDQLCAIARAHKVWLGVGLGRSLAKTSDLPVLITPSGRVTTPIASKSASESRVEIKVEFTDDGTFNLQLIEQGDEGRGIHIKVSSGPSSSGTAICTAQGDVLTCTATGWTQAIYARLDDALTFNA